MAPRSVQEVDWARTVLAVTMATARDGDLITAAHLSAVPVYLDCNATTPVDPVVRAEVLRYFDEEYGNAGSRTHLYGQRAKVRVNEARAQVAALVDAKADEVIFTSGATESDNLALLGLAGCGEDRSRRHVVSTRIEHKAVLEPLGELARHGFEVTLVPPTGGGWVDPDAIRAALRTDTLVVSVMAANNETGVLQPIAEIAEALTGSDAYFHVDAAQAFGKAPTLLRHQRIDLISISGHKIYGPKGVGALIGRRRGYRPPPLRPLMHGGGQERGLRPGTLPVPLIAGLGTAAALAMTDHQARSERVSAIRRGALLAFEGLRPHYNGDQSRTLAHTINLSVPGVDSEAALVALKELVAISNGSACTSQSYEPSHVLTAMGLSDDIVTGALRLSWCHLTPDVPWDDVANCLAGLRS
jgi:cysteine desulfurase